MSGASSCAKLNRCRRANVHMLWRALQSLVIDRVYVLAYHVCSKFISCLDGFVLQQNKWDSVSLDDVIDWLVPSPDTRAQLQNAGYFG